MHIKSAVISPHLRIAAAEDVDHHWAASSDEEHRNTYTVRTVALPNVVNIASKIFLQMYASANCCIALWKNTVVFVN